MTEFHRPFRITCASAALLLALVPALSHPAPGTLPSTPLFLGTSVKPNIMLAIDDSGSMDSEVLFASNDGALWWHTGDKSFIGHEAEGAVNFNTSGSANDTWKKYVYLFPNGTGAGNRVYGDSTHDHFAIPPLPQYAYARSAAYNKAYYDPSVTYAAWVDYGAVTYGNIAPTNAPSDPAIGTGTFNLTQDIRSSSANHIFKMFSGMTITKGTYYHDGGWKTATSDITVTSTRNIGIRYYPATYYVKTVSGTYSVRNASGQTVTGSCDRPDPVHYSHFHRRPGDFSSTSADALGPDGGCLKKVEIRPAVASYAGAATRTDCAAAPVCTYAEEMQNFANWFSYYRKRHLALRAGMASAFMGMNGIRVGVFTINNRTTVDMLDFDTQSDTLFAKLYGIGGNSGGTPNREALKHVGDQYKRTGRGAPITESCQKNFTIQFTDGYATTANVGVGNVDGGKGAPYADGYANTLGDIAMKYYSENLRPDITPAGNVPVPSGCNLPDPDPRLDCNANLHMNTYAVGLGAQGTLFGVTHGSVADAHAAPPAWPNVNEERDPRQVDDLYHAAVNGRGEILNADTPADLRTKLNDALKSILEKAGSAAAVTFNTGVLQADSTVYLALFNSTTWSGELLAYPLDPATGDISTTPSWSAAAALNSRNLATAPRTMLTFDGTDGVPFQWDSLTAAQRNDLKTAPNGALEDDSAGQARLAYLRGNRSDEGSGRNFRVRAGRLGDFVHSSPVYVGRPELHWPDTAPFPTVDKYSDFKAAQANRPGVIYIGGNDGMLHGFRASDGAEVLAYVPGNLFSTEANAGLHYLTDPAYNHRFYVDLTPTISDAYVKTTADGARRWATVLVGGERGGGRGLFALDVTNPANFSEDRAADTVMWEFTSAHDPDLGYTFSRPTIALLNNGKWAAIFGNGYNDSGSGTAQLFIVYLEGGLDGVWTPGTDYIKLDTKAGSPADRNGLATPGVVDLNGDGTADRVYAGDLQGNLWVFDLCNEAGGSCRSSGWGVAYKQGSTPNPLFTTANNQPITSTPIVVRHPTVSSGASNQPNVLVFFGTGQYLVEADKTTTHTQSFYGVWDNGTKQLDRSKLVAQTVTNNGNARLITDHPVDYEAGGTAKRYGCYVDLPDPGERVVANPVARGDIVYFNTMVPSSDACSAGGYGWLMSVSMENCGRPDRPVFDYNGDGVVDENDVVDDEPPVGELFEEGLPSDPSFLGDKEYTPGTDTEDGGDIDVREVEGIGGANTGRLSWDEITW